MVVSSLLETGGLVSKSTAVDGLDGLLLLLLFLLFLLLLLDGGRSLTLDLGGLLDWLVSLDSLGGLHLWLHGCGDGSSLGRDDRCHWGFDLNGLCCFGGRHVCGLCMTE